MADPREVETKEKVSEARAHMAQLETKEEPDKPAEMFGASAHRSRKNRCPITEARLEPYEGDNPHKQGTVVCETCGLRFKADEVICPKA